MALMKGSKACFEWLRTKRAGDVVSRTEVMDATDWSASSLKTYLTKNKLAPFLLALAGDRVCVLMDGNDVTEQYFDEVFTQTAPLNVNLAVDDKLVGELSSYTLVEPLGHGAVGHVWSARPDRIERGELVAVKVMLPREDLLADSKIVDVRKRFRREVRNGAMISHPNVVRYIDSGEIQRNPFLVMELASTSVGRVIGRSRPLPLKKAVSVVVDVVNGLAHLHTLGCPHWDVKPANILAFGNHFKLADLGIVKWTDFDRRLTTGGTITRESMQLGSWFYMAPEQQQNPHEAVPASDVYALGVSWIEMLTGNTPSPQAIGAGQYPRPCNSEELCSFLRRMVAYLPEARPTLDEIGSVCRGLAS